MRACFLGQNVCALGFGVATLQTPPMMVEGPDVPPAIIADAMADRLGKDLSAGFIAAPLPAPVGPFVTGLIG